MIDTAPVASITSQAGPRGGHDHHVASARDPAAVVAVTRYGPDAGSGNVRRVAPGARSNVRWKIARPPAHPVSPDRAAEVSPRRVASAATSVPAGSRSGGDPSDDRPAGGDAGLRMRTVTVWDRPFRLVSRSSDRTRPQVNVTGAGITNVGSRRTLLTMSH